MEAQEFDIALTDLETRVDRLRALYENWFRGYEKTEPSVPRKDVERRVYGLRKELPRNTALRFRYHQLYQRFTTLANYWQRTARQVEEGTYRLQLQRMRRKKDDIAARTLAPPAREEGDTLAAKSYELSLDETLDVGQLFDDAELDQLARAIDAPSPAPAASPTKVAVSTRFARPNAEAGTRPSLSLESLQSFGGLPGMLSSNAENDREPVRTARAQEGETVRSPARPSLIDESTRRALPNALTESLGAVALTNAGGAAIRQGGGPALSPSPGAAPAGAGRASEPTATMAAPARAAPLGGAAGRAFTAHAERPAPTTNTTAMPGATAATGSSGSSAATGPNGRPPPPPAAPPGVPVARPAPAVLRVPAPPVRSPAPPPPSAASSGGSSLSDQHIRRIYDEYVAARRKNNEGDVRYETLAGSIQKMLPDLQKRHSGKRIDFEIVLKDGRVGLKPKAT